jgi:ParB family chromosome partitioning protein
MAKRTGLGRGLGALIRDSEPVSDEKQSAGIATVPVDRIKIGDLQPRKVFDELSLSELAESMKERGVLQPLLVRPKGDDYELIAGERRLRAGKLAGLNEMPVIISEADDVNALEIALIENLQREDLNIIEEAEGYRSLADRFGLTQEQIATRVGKARVTVTNALRLLGLPEDLKQLVSGGKLSAGHAKVLSGLDIEQEQRFFAQMTVDENLSVRNLEKRIEKSRRVARKPRASRSDLPGEHLTYLTDKLHAHFGTSIRVAPSRTYANGKKGKGCIEIDFYSNDELDRILQILGISAE